MPEVLSTGEESGLFPDKRTT